MMLCETFDLYCFSRCGYQMVYSTAVLLRCPPPPGPSPPPLWSLVSPAPPSLLLCPWIRHIVHCLRSTLRCVQGLYYLNCRPLKYVMSKNMPINDELQWFPKEEDIYLINYMNNIPTILPCSFNYSSVSRQLSTTFALRFISQSRMTWELGSCTNQEHNLS